MTPLDVAPSEERAACAAVKAMSDHASLANRPAAESDEPTTDLRDIVAGVEGNTTAQRRLANRGAALGLFARALAGDRKADAALRQAGAVELDALCATLLTAVAADDLAVAHPDLQLLLQAVHGDAAALRRLQRRKPRIGKLAAFLVQVCKRADCAAPTTNDGAMGEEAVADVGLLVGEQHLRDGHFSQAVEAFTRTLGVEPTADAYEGRATAYRSLAEADEQEARRLRGT